MNRTWILLTSIGLAAAIPNVTLAVDGVVLISQSSALAGNVTPGDAPGFPVTISVSGSYRLSSNLTVPDANTDAIDITASHVTIDLNGFSIIGPTVCSGSPIICSPTGNGIGINGNDILTDTTVLNGDIHGMGFVGIILGLLGGRVENVHVSSNGVHGIQVSEGSKVSSCIATANGQRGISADSGSVISGNTAYANGGSGIVAHCPDLVEGNSAQLNAGGNITTFGSGCVLANNAAP
jgi:hypothetical protein